MIGRLKRVVARVSGSPAPAPAPPAPAPEPPPLTEQQIAHARWVACNGDQTLRQEYALSPGEVVVDLGGYHGQWASDIYARYRTRVFVFEPVPQFAEMIRKRFRSNADIQVVEAAVGATDGRMQIGVAADASSLFGERDSTVEVAVLDFVDWCRSAGITQIGLLKVNIEGGEYELLEHLIATGAIRQVREIQVQFHNFVPDAEQRMAAIQEKLAGTHERTYEFKFVWENWRRLP
jgi:FkbM family methyltransferase